MTYNNEKHNSLIKEIWQQSKYVIILTFLLLVIFCLGYFTTNMDTKEFWFGVLFCLLSLFSSFGWAIIIVFFIREKRINEFRNWGYEWEVKANNLLDFLKDRYPQYKQIIRKDAHLELLSKIRDENPNENIQAIQFLGSMVGFSYIYPKPLKEHICLNQGNLTVDIIGTKANYEETNPDENFVIYPISLVIKTLKLLFESNNLNVNGIIKFNIYYFPYDIIEAFVAFGNKTVMSVHALDPKNAELIIEDQYMGILIDYESKAASSQRINRYLAVFNRLKKRLKDNKETWDLTFNNYDISLEINGKSFWDFNCDSGIKFCTPEEKNVDIKLNSKDRIKTFIENSYNSLVLYCKAIKSYDEKILR